MIFLQLFLLNIQQLQLRAGSLGYENWEVTPVPMYMRYKMFNWTNPEDVREPGYKPNFVEMGPYVFLEKHVRVNVSFHPENGTVHLIKFELGILCLKCQMAH